MSIKLSANNVSKDNFAVVSRFDSDVGRNGVTMIVLELAIDNRGTHSNNNNRASTFRTEIKEKGIFRNECYNNQSLRKMTTDNDLPRFGSSDKKNKPPPSFANPFRKKEVAIARSESTDLTSPP